jgi:serine/threonine protein kinase
MRYRDLSPLSARLGGQLGPDDRRGIPRDAVRRVMRRALLVGIDAYPFGSLNYCVKDAQDLAERLASPECGFEVEVLLDQDATRKGILRSLKRLRDARLEVALLYLSGHGIRTDHGDYFLTIDGVDGDEGIDLRALFRLLGEQGTTAETRLSLLDFCHSGSGRSKISSLGQSLKADQIKQVVSPSRGNVVMAACEPHQQAFEQATLQHGIFTHYLLTGLDGAASVDGVVTAHGLYAYVARAFGDNERQRPVWRGDIAGSLVLADLRNRADPLVVSPEPVAAGEVVRAVTEEADRRLEEYQSQLAVPLDEWRTYGWLQAGGSLAELLHWFERQQATYPELNQHSDFMRSFQAARGRLAQLANIDIGTVTSMGIATERLGAGAFGSIWKVVKSPGEIFAYKAYHPGELHLNDKVSRFQRGYRAMRQLVHANVVRVYEYTQAPIGFFMDYIDGPNLRNLAPANFEPDKIIQLLTTIAHAIRFAHASGIVHRDIKPENIIAKWDDTQSVWTPYLTDFDLAWFSTATQVTKEGFGAQFYSAPEQFARPNAAVSHKETVDVYSFGQLMFFSIVGTDPQPLGLGDNIKVLQRRLSSWSSWAGAQALLDLYQQCTEFEPTSRPQSLAPIVSSLGQVDINVRRNSPSFSEDEFFHELLFSVVGFSLRDQEYGGKYTTRSGRSEIMISEGAWLQGTVYFTIRIRRLGELSLHGAPDFHSARRSVRRRVDRALYAYGQSFVHRIRGDGLDEVSLSFDHVPLTPEGVAKAAAAIADTLAAFETV